MTTNILKSHPFFIEKRTINKFIALIFAVAYAFFIVTSLQLQYSSGSGDVGSYMHFFNQYEGASAPELTLRADGAFRLSIFFLRDFLNESVLTVLGYLAFIMSLIVFYIFSTNIRSQKYLIYFLPLVLMVFFTPNVQVLFSSNIRSGIAFTILLIAVLYSQGITRLFLLGLASIIHLAMLPMIAMYYFYFILNSKFVNSAHLLSVFLLILSAAFIAIVGSAVHVEAVNSASFAYNLLILYLLLILVAVNKRVLKNVFGFVSVGLLVIYLVGLIIEVSYIRYVGNAVLFYLLFLIKEGEFKSIQAFTICYFPFFLLTLSYSVTNLL
jgi:hypothetical protein